MPSGKMTGEAKGILVVGIRHGVVDVESLKRRISGIRGVFDVQFNYLTHKLTIKYDGSDRVLNLINSNLDGVIRSANSEKSAR